MTFHQNINIVSMSLITLLILVSPIVYALSSTGTATIEREITNRLETEDYVSVVIALNETKRIDVLHSLSEKDFIPHYTFNHLSWFSGMISKEGLSKLRYNPAVLDIHTPKRTFPLLLDSVPLINASYAWTSISGINITGKNQVICVVDTGVNASHPDLVGRVKAEKCFCDENEGAPGGGCCPGGVNESSNATDEANHGTRVAGVIAANGGLVGVAPDAELVAVRVTKNDGNGIEPDLARGIAWCYENKDQYNITLITVSMGATGWYSGSCDARDAAKEVNNATREGLFVSVASGNECNISGLIVPACASNATSIGMTYDHSEYLGYSWPCCTDWEADLDSVACLGNRNENLDLLAPGYKINSTDNTSGYTDVGAGTSLSAPHVAGAAALLAQYENLRNNRTLAPNEIKNRFKDTGKLIYDSGENSNMSGTNLFFSRVDIYAALFPIDVYGFQRLEASDTQNIFRFKIKNNYNNKTKEINWSFDIGNGTTITSTNNISLPPGKTSFVYFEHNYTDGDIYEVTASASSGDVSDSETLTLTIGDIIAYDMREIYSNGKERVFNFRVLNNMSETRTLNWTFYTGEDHIDSNESTTLSPNNESIVYFHYNYSLGGSYLVYAMAKSSGLSDFTNFLDITVPS